MRKPDYQYESSTFLLIIYWKYTLFSILQGNFSSVCTQLSLIFSQKAASSKRKQKQRRANAFGQRVFNFQVTHVIGILILYFLDLISGTVDTCKSLFQNCASGYCQQLDFNRQIIFHFNWNCNCHQMKSQPDIMHS